MKGFLYFLVGLTIFTEISMFMRAANGLEQFSFIYLTTMIILAVVGYFFFSKARQQSKVTNAASVSSTDGKIENFNRSESIENNSVESIEQSRSVIVGNADDVILDKSEDDAVNKANSGDEKELKHAVEGFILDDFFALNIADQTKVLEIFIQENHNNPFVNQYLKSYKFLFFVNSKDEMFDNVSFKLKSQNQTFLKSLITFLKSIEGIETIRLFAIICHFNGDIPGRENSISKCLSSLNDSPFYPIRYIFCILKTKLDLLIASSNYEESSFFAEKVYKMLIDQPIKNENTSWLKYQYCKSLLELSQHVKINFSNSQLIGQLQQFNEDAYDEDYLNTLY